MKLIFSLLAFCLDSHAASVKTVRLQPRQIYSVSTAIGHSTLLNFESAPTSVALGDQDAFKVEYIGKSVLIKPLIQAAQTNLFVFVGETKFGFRLLTVEKEAADFSINILPQKQHIHQSKPQTLAFSQVGKQVQNKDYTLQLHSSALSKSKANLILRINALSSNKNVLDLKNSFRFTQNNKTVPLTAKHFDYERQNRLSGLFLLRTLQLTSGPLEITLKTPERPLTLQIPVQTLLRGTK